MFSEWIWNCIVLMCGSNRLQTHVEENIQKHSSLTNNFKVDLAAKTIFWLRMISLFLASALSTKAKVEKFKEHLKTFSKFVCFWTAAKSVCFNTMFSLFVGVFVPYWKGSGRLSRSTCRSTDDDDDSLHCQSILLLWIIAFILELFVLRKFLWREVLMSNSEGFL